MIALDINSEFGVFSKPISNVGGLLTYEIPPKTSIIGLLGASLGFNFIETIINFKNLKIGIKVLNPIKKERIIFNSHYGGRTGRILNIKQEILISPAYKIYFDFNFIKNDKDASKKIKNKIRNLLKLHNIEKKINDLEEGFETLYINKISYYSLYMGRNSFPLKYKFNKVDLKEFNFSKNSDKFINTSAAIPRDAISNFILSTDDDYGIPKELNVALLNRIPLTHKLPNGDGNHNREIAKFKDFILPPLNKELSVIPVKNKYYSYYIDENNNLIVFF